MYNLLEYISNYSDTTRISWLQSKDEATKFNANIGDTNDFKSFEYKTKLIESPVAANGILENATIVVLLKYLCYEDDNSNNIIFTIKDTKLYVSVVILLAKDN